MRCILCVEACGMPLTCVLRVASCVRQSISGQEHIYASVRTANSQSAVAIRNPLSVQLS